MLPVCLSAFADQIRAMENNQRLRAWERGVFWEEPSVGGLHFFSMVLVPLASMFGEAHLKCGVLGQ